MSEKDSKPVPVGEIEIGPSSFDLFLEKYHRKLIVALVVVLIAAAAFFAYTRHKESLEKKAGDALLSALETSRDFNREKVETVIKDHAGTEAAKTAQFLLAEELWEAGKIAEGEKAFKDFIAQHPKHALVPHSYLAMGSLLVMDGRTNLAKGWFSEALLLENHHEVGPAALISLGDIAKSEGKLNEARAFYERARKEYPDSFFVQEGQEPESQLDTRLKLVDIHAPNVVDPLPAAPQLPATPKTEPTLPSATLSLGGSTPTAPTVPATTPSPSVPATPAPQQP